MINQPKQAGKSVDEMGFNGLRSSVDMSVRSEETSFSYRTGTFVPELDSTYVMPKDTK